MTVVEDHLLYADALASALVAEGHAVERVGVRVGGVQGGDLCAAILATRPAVVLLNVDLGRGFDGVGVIRRLHRTGVIVVVVTGSGDDARWGECLWHGARAVLSKSTGLQAMVETIARVVANRPVLAGKDSSGLLRRYREERSARQLLCARLDTLTPREQEILAALMRGRHVAEIARDRCVAESTVRTQVRSILLKLEVSSQLAAVGAALQARWVQPLPA